MIAVGECPSLARCMNTFPLTSLLLRRKIATATLLNGALYEAYSRDAEREAARAGPPAERGRSFATGGGNDQRREQTRDRGSKFFAVGKEFGSAVSGLQIG